MALFLLFVCGLILGSQRSEAEVPVLVELFTSEGCSSCPPADAFLKRLVSEQPVPGVQVIALGQHVDYWDRLGWKDPYSSGDFTRRQQLYGRALGLRSIYTPQIIVDGHREMVGSDEDSALEAIRAAGQSSKGRLAIRWPPRQKSSRKVRIGVRIESLPDVSGRRELMVAITEKGLSSDVSRGENAGRVLHHAPTVRLLMNLGPLPDAGRLPFDIPVRVPWQKTWKREHVQLVAFVQDRQSRRILAAVTSGITETGPMR